MLPTWMRDSKKVIFHSPATGSVFYCHKLYVLWDKMICWVKPVVIIIVWLLLSLNISEDPVPTPPLRQTRHFYMQSGFWDISPVFPIRLYLIFWNKSVTGIAGPWLKSLVIFLITAQDRRVPGIVRAQWAHILWFITSLICPQKRHQMRISVAGLLELIAVYSRDVLFIGRVCDRGGSYTVLITDNRRG